MEQLWPSLVSRYIGEKRALEVGVGHDAPEFWDVALVLYWKWKRELVESEREQRSKNRMAP